ncbi:MAG: hypothetical protein U0791_20485 [Gemmataceae bacterium]
MITLPSAVCRELTEVFRRLGRGRVQTEVVLEWTAGRDGLTLQAVAPEVAVRHRTPGRRPEARGAGSLDSLAIPNGSTESNVTLRPDPRRSSKPFPVEPKRFTPVAPGLWAALAAAASVTARDAESRFVLNRIQLRGGRKTIVASDSKQLLVQTGFAFPWSDDLLVPSSDIFAALAGRTPPETAVARTPGYVWIRSGPWTVALTIDSGGRFPDVDPLLVRAEKSGSELIVAGADRVRLVREIPRLPGGRAETRSVTIDLAGPAVRAGEAGASSASIPLPQSRVQGRRTVVTCDRAYLLAALKLGFTRMSVSTADQPLVWRDERRTYLFLPLAECEPSRSKAAPSKPPVARVPRRPESQVRPVVSKPPKSKSPPPEPVPPRLSPPPPAVRTKPTAHRSRRRLPRPEPGLWSGLWFRVRGLFRAR